LKHLALRWFSLLGGGSRWIVATALAAFAISKLRLGIDPRTMTPVPAQWMVTAFELAIALCCALTRARWPLGLAAMFGLGAAVRGAWFAPDPHGTCGCLGAGIPVSPVQSAFLAGAVGVLAVIGYASGRSDSTLRNGPGFCAEHVSRVIAVLSLGLLMSFAIEIAIAG